MTTPQVHDIKRSLAGPYPIEAYEFVRAGLGFKARQVYGEYAELSEGEHHVTGQQLCLGLRDYAIELYGLLAPVVLETWNIRRTEDFGRIVFEMIERGLLSKNDNDSFEDFRSVFDFDEVFCPSELRSYLDAR